MSAAMTTETPWLLVNQAANYLAMHPDTVRTLLRRGDLKGVKTGGTWRTRTDWCDTYLMKGTAA